MDVWTIRKNVPNVFSARRYLLPPHITTTAVYYHFVARWEMA